MEFLNNTFEEIKRAKNSEKINDFLIKLTKDPSENYLDYIEYFINNLDSDIFDKIKLNLIFLIGEIGKETILDERYVKFLIETYYTSDRWVRNEIIQAIGKISANSDLTDDVIKLVGYAVNDDYSPIKVNALQVILNFKKFPLTIRGHIFRALNSKIPELEKFCAKILDKFLPDYNQLVDSLNYSDNYKILKPYSIRTLLLMYFYSPINLEPFRQKILNLNWEIEYKEIYLKEIDTYEKILLKNL